MRLVLFAVLIFLAGSRVYCRYSDVKRDEVLRDSEVPHGMAQDDVQLEQGELENEENVADKKHLDEVAQHVRNEKRGFRSFFYNYLDEMAMSICASVPSPRGGMILAIRRACSGSLTCSHLCSRNFLFSHNNRRKWIKQKKWTCLESLRVYKSRPVLADNFASNIDSYKFGLQVYRYHSCVARGCGPNYCCCQY